MGCEGKRGKLPGLPVRGLLKLPDTSVAGSRGAIAQLGERIVRNDEVVGSIPTSSTKFLTLCRFVQPQSAGSLRHAHESVHHAAQVGIAPDHNAGLVET